MERRREGEKTGREEGGDEGKLILEYKGSKMRSVFFRATNTKRNYNNWGSVFYKEGRGGERKGKREKMVDNPRRRATEKTYMLTFEHYIW